MEVRGQLPDLDNVIDVIAHSHEQIEKQFATTLHLHLHGSAPLESLATSNDQSQVMSAEPRFRVWGLVICIPGRSQDRLDLDAGSKSLLAKSKAFQILQAVRLGSTIDNGIAKYLPTDVGR